MCDVAARSGERNENKGKSSISPCDQAWFMSATQVGMTDTSACGRIIFHIARCSDYVGLILSRFPHSASHGKKKTERNREIVVSFAAVIRVVTQRSSPLVNLCQILT